jgi:hypothetical protein
MKRCLSNYAKLSEHPKVAANCANAWQLSIPSHMLVDGKDDAPAIGEYARISSICAAAPSSTICMSWPVLKCILLSFKMLRDFSTDTLERSTKLDGELAS